MPREIDCRREDFSEKHCVKIRLSDGQRWFLPKPFVEVRSVFRDGEAVATLRGVSCGDELDTLIEQISEADSVVDRIRYTMTLGALLLHRNYNLDDRQLEELFVYRGGEPESEAMVKTIIETATGTGGPKR